jgi:hypothetical protein
MSKRRGMPSATSRTQFGVLVSQSRARAGRGSTPLRRSATVSPLLPYETLTKKARFPVRRFHTTAARVLTLADSYEKARLSKPNAWHDRPEPPESLGNLLQQIARKKPVAILVFQSLAAEILALLETGV